jgi:hypothetical protein
MAEQDPRDDVATHQDEARRQNVEQPRHSDAPPFTGPSTDPLSTWGTGGSEDDKSGQRSNPRPEQPAAGEPDAETPTKGAWRERDANRRATGEDDLKA